ncbi:hypothetical protein CRUP_033543, partial [Coryphaenoides rupestris]
YALKKPSAVLYKKYNSKCPEGTKPMLVFAGDAFDTNNELRRLKSLFIDFFRGPAVPAVRLAGLEHILHITALEDKVTAEEVWLPDASHRAGGDRTVI